MFEVVAFAFVVSVAFVAIGRTAMRDHRSSPKGWRHIREHDRVYYMRRAKSG